MNNKTDLQSKISSKNLQEEKPTTDDVILLLISILSQNNIKNSVNSEHSLVVELDNKPFELVINKVESFNE